MPWGEFLTIVGQTAIGALLMLMLALVALGAWQTIRGQRPAQCPHGCETPDEHDETMERLVDLDPADRERPSTYRDGLR